MKNISTTEYEYENENVVRHKQNKVLLEPIYSDYDGKYYQVKTITGKYIWIQIKGTIYNILKRIHDIPSIYCYNKMSIKT